MAFSQALDLEKAFSCQKVRHLHLHTSLEDGEARHMTSPVKGYSGLALCSNFDSKDENNENVRTGWNSSMNS